MAMLDLSNVTPNEVPVMMVAQSNQAQQLINVPRVAGVCRVIGNAPDQPLSLDSSISPGAVALNYLFEYEKVKGLDEKSAKITFLEPPKHGKVVNEVGNVSGVIKGGNYYSYIPDAGYYDKDKIVALVEIGGYTIKVVYFIKVVNGDPGEGLTDKYCKHTFWKISQSDGSELSVFDLASLQRSSALSTLIADAKAVRHNP